MNVSPEFEESMDTTYTIKKPVECKTWPYHTDWTDIEKCHSKTLRKKGSSERLINCNDDYDGEFEEEYEDEFCNDEKAFLSTTFNLDMFIVKKTKKKRQNTNHSDESMSSSDYPRYGKGCFFIIDDPMISSSDVQEDTVKIDFGNDPTVEENFEVNAKQTFKEFESLVNNKQINSDFLAKRFDTQYIEGNGSPRQFVIFNNSFSYNEIILSAKILDSGHTAHNCSAICIRLFNISNEFIECLESIFQQDVLNFELLVDMCFPKNKNVIKISTSKAVIKHEMVQKSIKPFAEVRSMNDICRDVCVKMISSQDAVSPSQQNLVHHSMCLICLTVDITTSLKKCCHQVCSSCWTTYIDIKIKSGCYEIFCPYTNCENKLDIVFILSFIDCSFATMYIKKCCELNVQRDMQIKFCPSASCSMVAVNKTNPSLNQVESNYKDAVASSSSTSLENNPSVFCSCKLLWCFSCEEPEHWPSSCEANKMYQLKKRKENNMLFDNKGRLNETTIECRRCPLCRNHIIKSDGCNHMLCRCGEAFCWACLKRWKNHAPCNPVNDIVITFSSADLFTKGSKKHRMRGKAINFSADVKKVHNLRQKLKITKILSNDQKSDVLIASIDKAFLVLSSGYKLLENLSAGAAMCQSRHGLGRISKFINDCSFNLKFLYDILDKSNLKEIKIGDVIKERKNIELCFKKLKELGLVNNNMLEC